MLSAASSCLLFDPDVMLGQGKGWEFCGLTYRDPSGINRQVSHCNEGMHRYHPSYHTTTARVPCLTWSEGQRCRWTRSPSLCSRWGAVPVPRPSCGPFCSGGKMCRAGGKHRTIKTTNPQNFHVKDLWQLFTKHLSSSAQ